MQIDLLTVQTGCSYSQSTLANNRGETESDEIFMNGQYYIQKYNLGTRSTSTVWKSSSKITCIKVLNPFIVYGTSSGSLSILKKNESGDYCLFYTTNKFKSVTRIDITGRDTGYLIVGISYTKEILSIWIEAENKENPLENMTKSDEMFTAVCLLEMNNSFYLLAGGVSNRLFLYKYNKTSLEIVHCWKGHEDFIRSIDVFHDKKIVKVLTASGDRRIRVWLLEPSLFDNNVNLKIEKTDCLKDDQTSNACSILSGHKEGVNSAKWSNSGENIVSCSDDCSVWVWEFIDCVWLPKTQHFSSFKFKDACCLSIKQTLCIGVVTYSGSTLIMEDRDNNLIPVSIISGHLSSANSCEWFSKDILATCGEDKTIRLWKCDNSGLLNSWKEIERPASHGHIINNLIKVDEKIIAYSSDEKPIRVIERSEFIASIPPMDLSAIETTEKRSDEWYIDEKDLRNKTLWVERKKLYSNRNNVSCLTISNRGKKIASACEARKKEDTLIRLWDSETLKEITPIVTPHRLTITGLQYSQDGTFLLSISRDRSLTLYKDGKVISTIVAHKRAILACCWIDDVRFSTGSRDGVLKIWKIENNGIFVVQEVEHLSGIPAMAIMNGFLIIGQESGAVSFLNHTTMKSTDLDTSLCPVLSITDIKVLDEKIAMTSMDGSIRILSAIL
eukprot:GHVP01005017.1.p1 GENE.GHVP01005017.1~~GHVP01005017.1.p1  ORF type:complete len:671 (-),score=106.02 GHVP01005017.1:5-2017(-)